MKIRFPDYPKRLWDAAATYLVLEEDGSFTFNGLKATLEEDAEIEWEFGIHVALLNKFDISARYCDSQYRKLIYGYAAKGWRFTDKEIERLKRDEMYRAYRVGGIETINGYFEQLFFEVATLIGFDMRKAINKWIADMNADRNFAFNLRKELSVAAIEWWKNHNVKEMNRRRKWYVGEKVNDFRLNDYWDQVPNDELRYYIMYDGNGKTRFKTAEEFMLPDIRKIWARGIENFKTCLPSNPWVYGEGEQYLEFRELLSKGDFEAEGNAMHHCIGSGGYFGNAVGNSGRAFHVVWHVRSFMREHNNYVGNGFNDLAKQALLTLFSDWPDIIQIEMREVRYE
jgi:hypothetical protein